MTVRQLRVDEWWKLAELFPKELGEQPPHPPSSVVVVAESEGEIVGLLCARLLLHTEPLWVRESHRGSSIMHHLVAELHRAIPDVGYALATTGNWKVGRLLERLGFKKLECSIYRWVKGGQDGESSRQ